MFKNKYVSSILRHLISAGGVYIGTQVSGLPGAAGYVAAGVAALLGLLDKYENQR
jgi:hypothetical protein